MVRDPYRWMCKKEKGNEVRVQACSKRARRQGVWNGRMINGKHHCQWDQLPRRAVGTEKRSLTATLWHSLFFLTQPFVVLFLVIVVLVVFCCLSFKRSIFFPLRLTYWLLQFQCTPTTLNNKKKEQESQKHHKLQQEPHFH
jgi:hypothetical protein